ncbi:kinase-likeprotein [Moniliophthora roreri MCA 2997]|uniref:Kinase-likeprotein n=1 Tax=Moniliophthora roreri (strain MCA 2997) TaxID=1381753 RepID=V2WEN4_MONRO|nr:kinase-likeprotein [Moniliophthora roreri MCA 2997]
MFSRANGVLNDIGNNQINQQVEKWIEMRLKRKSMGFNSESIPSESIHGVGIGTKDEGLPLDTPKVYKNLLSFLIDVSHRGSVSSLRRALDKLSRFMSSRDLISSLVESRGYRLHLLQISAEFKLNSSDDRHLHDALRKDEEAIAGLLSSAIGSEGNKFKDALLALKDEDAQSCADLIQDVIDKCSPERDEFKYQAQRLLVKLCEAQDVLPSSLFIKGVIRQDTDAHFGGSFGDIYRATYNGSEVAIKRIRVFQDTVASERRKIFKRLCREALLWRTLKHPFLLPFFGVDSDTFPGFFCLVSPWMAKGTILRHLGENGGQDIDLRLFEIAQGLAYLHSQHIIHGDLRGSNILVDSDNHACIADFGLAVFSDVTLGTNSSQHGGSVRWMAPELLDPGTFGLEHFRRTFASDVYSFACVCTELYTGDPPFNNIPHGAAVLLKVMKGERPARPFRMGNWLWNIVEMCWNQENAGRPSMSEVVKMMQSRCPGRQLVPLAIQPGEAVNGGSSLLINEDTAMSDDPTLTRRSGEHSRATVANESAGSVTSTAGPRQVSGGIMQALRSRIATPHRRESQEVVAEQVPRFRVLVMGRMNAGKTTIMQAMTRSSDGLFVVHDQDGNQINSGSILQSSAGHSIGWEITYLSNPGFVFHNSRGVETGSRNGIEKLRDFIERRLRRVPLNEKLHVIWYCLPTDTDRPLYREEMAFFQQDTGDVPVIAVFTKFEARVTKAFSQLRDNGMSVREARRHAPEKARQDFEELFSERKLQMRYPPAAYVYLQNVNKPETTCDELSLVTHRAIQAEAVSRLFAMVQRNSVEVSMGTALV